MGVHLLLGISSPFRSIFLRTQGAELKVSYAFLPASCFRRSVFFVSLDLMRVRTTHAHDKTIQKKTPHTEFMTTNHTWTRPEEIMDIIHRNRIHADVTRSKHTRSSWEETTHWCHEMRSTHGIHSQPCGASEGMRQVATKECDVIYSVWFFLVRVQMGCTQSSKASEGQGAAGNKEVLCSLFCVAFPRSCTDGRLAAFKSI